MLQLAAPEMDKDLAQLDADGSLFNLRNGVLNLKTFTLLPHSPALMQGP
jgi:phage/plasmid-associated DNA primase